MTGSLQWLDALATKTEVPAFDIDGDGSPDGSSDHPSLVSLPSGSGQAWIVSIKKDPNALPTDPLAARLVTIRAKATVGTISKMVQLTFRVELGMSDIFRYAYFINNYGWFEAGSGASVKIFGEVRSNGDLAFKSGTFYVLGDLYASKNPSIINPDTTQPSTGAITGDPSEYADLSEYWSSKPSKARPARRLTFPGQPAIDLKEQILAPGYGWNSDDINQVKYPGQLPQPIPYMGDLKFYADAAKQKGSRLTYYDIGPDGTPGTADDVNVVTPETTVDAVYKGPDGIEGINPDTGINDDSHPLVLYGTPVHPVEIHGPVIVPGDVIIRGVVKGRGTIYAGRNVHIVGDVTYASDGKVSEWPALERDTTTGTIYKSGSSTSLGTVSDDGIYVAP